METQSSAPPTTQTIAQGKPHYRRALLPIIDRKFQFKVTLLVVGVITLSHLGLGAYMYQNIAEFAGKLADFVPDLEQDVQYFRGLMLRYMLLTIVATFLVIILLSLYFSSRISGPLYNMTRVFRHVAGGDFSKRVALRRHDELKEFSEVSNELLQSMDDRMKKVRRSIELLRGSGKSEEALRLLEETLVVAPKEDSRQ